jgi:hypothetical protein
MPPFATLSWHSTSMSSYPRRLILICRLEAVLMRWEGSNEFVDGSVRSSWKWVSSPHLFFVPPFSFDIDVNNYSGATGAGRLVFLLDKHPLVYVHQRFPNQLLLCTFFHLHPANITVTVDQCHQCPRPQYGGALWIEKEVSRTLCFLSVFVMRYKLATGLRAMMRDPIVPIINNSMQCSLWYSVPGVSKNSFHQILWS